MTTVDSGTYKCCAEYSDEDSVRQSICHSANVIVEFASYDDSSYDPNPSPSPTPGADLCHDYPDSSLGICSNVLKGLTIHADNQEKIHSIELKIEGILRKFRTDKIAISPECEKYAPNALCHYLLPTCDSTGSYLQLCKSDCEMVKFSKCHAEFKKAAEGDDAELNLYADSFECNKLPDSDKKCTSIGLPPVLDKDDKCYAGEGIGESILSPY